MMLEEVEYAMREAVKNAASSNESPTICMFSKSHRPLFLFLDSASIGIFLKSVPRSLAPTTSTATASLLTKSRFVFILILLMKSKCAKVPSMTARSMPPMAS
jgi:hypothetical protein